MEKYIKFANSKRRGWSRSKRRRGARDPSDLLQGQIMVGVFFYIVCMYSMHIVRASKMPYSSRAKFALYGHHLSCIEQLYPHFLSHVNIAVLLDIQCLPCELQVNHIPLLCLALILAYHKCELIVGVHRCQLFLHLQYLCSPFQCLFYVPVQMKLYVHRFPLEGWCFVQSFSGGNKIDHLPQLKWLSTGIALTSNS